MTTLNHKEFGINRYKRFIKNILKTDTIYFFYWVENKRIYGTESHDFENADGSPKGVLPFWSNYTYPQIWLHGYEENGLILTYMSLNDFIDLLKDMIINEEILGLEWNAQGVGVELPASEVYADILSAQTPE